MKLQEYLQSNQLIMDGAMGTYYASLTRNNTALVELANENDSDTIKEIHFRYIKAGARLLRTNTFAANHNMLQGTISEQKELIRKACLIAKEAVDEAKKEGIKESIFIGGSIGPIAVLAKQNDDEVIKEYQMICDTMIECGVDAIVFETFDQLDLIRPVISYIKQKSDVFVMTNFSINKNGYTQTGISGQSILDEIKQVKEIDACGFNCGIGSGHMYQIVKTFQFPENKYIAILPNASYPEQIKNRLIFAENTKYFEENISLIRELGVHIVGGCCGTTPAYIKTMSESKKTYPTKQLQEIEVVSKEEKEVLKEENKILKMLQEGKKVVAVELDPPYDADITKIVDCAKKLNHADIITIADSPMGRSRVDSILMSIKIANETGKMVMPHISCRDKNMIAMRSTLLGAHIHGIRNCLFVTGDPVPSVSRLNTTAVFDYNSIRLMQFMQQMNEEHFSKDPIVYGGALNHARGFVERVAERMQKKVDAGASYFLTQPIYSKEDMERIAKLKELVDTKILCGIMPLVSYRNANFIKNEMTGIFVPDEIVNRYHPEMSKEDAEWVGAEISSEIIEQLKDIADGFYFMLPFNRVSLMDKIKIPT